jgi:hypothetical protein
MLFTVSIICLTVISMVVFIPFDCRSIRYRVHMIQILLMTSFSAMASCSLLSQSSVNDHIPFVLILYSLSGLYIGSHNTDFYFMFFTVSIICQRSYSFRFDKLPDFISFDWIRYRFTLYWFYSWRHVRQWRHVFHCFNHLSTLIFISFWKTAWFYTGWQYWNKLIWLITSC